MFIDKPRGIEGGLRKDERGGVSFFNEFKFKGIKRFYVVENANTEIIRAFHGHMKEAKYVYVVSGSILLCAVYLDNKKNPSKKNKVHRFILKATTPKIIYIPPSYANGFKALEPDSRVIFFSTSTLKGSLEDDYRFSSDYWGEDIWKEDDVESN